MIIQSEIVGLAELKRLAAAADKGGHHIYTSIRDSNNWATNDAFIDAATPETVLALIAENELLCSRADTAECRLEVSEDTLRTIRRCLRQAEGDIDQNRELVAALRLFVAASYPVSTEIDKRGHRWCEAWLDDALEGARNAMRKVPGQ